MNTIANELGWAILWMTGMCIVPILMAIIVIWISNDAEYGMLAFWASAILYTVGTAILLINI